MFKFLLPLYVLLQNILVFGIRKHKKYYSIEICFILSVYLKFKISYEKSEKKYIRYTHIVLFDFRCYYIYIFFNILNDY